MPNDDDDDDSVLQRFKMNANIRHTYQAIFLTFVPATVTLSLRLWGRWTKKVRWWYDDYLAIAAWVSLMPALVLQSLATTLLLDFESTRRVDFEDV